MNSHVKVLNAVIAKKLEEEVGIETSKLVISILNAYWEERKKYENEWWTGFVFGIIIGVSLGGFAIFSFI